MTAVTAASSLGPQTFYKGPWEVRLHAQTNQWTGVAHADALLGAADDAQGQPVSRSLAPARGALFGVLLGALCWTAIATAVWIAL